MQNHPSGRQPLTRRDALARIGSGFGLLAFAGLLNESVARAATRARDESLPAGCDHPPKATAVIFLMMNGGLSQVDSFDPKPMLDKYHGQPLPGGQIATERKNLGTLGYGVKAFAISTARIVCWRISSSVACSMYLRWMSDVERKVWMRR